MEGRGGGKGELGRRKGPCPSKQREGTDSGAAPTLAGGGRRGCFCLVASIKDKGDEVTG